MGIVTKIKKLQESAFLKSIAILAGGSAAAQLIAMATIPILTRLYTPEDFNVLAVYTSIFGIISVAACLGFDLAVPLPSTEKDAVGLMILAIISVFIVTGATAILVYSVPNEIVKSYGLYDYLWMLPMGVFFTGTYNAIQSLLVRYSQFLDISSTRLRQSSWVATSQIGMGYSAPSAFGLLLGQIVNGLIGTLYLLKFVKPKYNPRHIEINRLFYLLGKYRRFPQFTSLETLTNSAGVQVPVLLIATYAAGAEAGFLILAMRVMQTPLGLLGKAVSQVYLSKAPEEYRRNNLGAFTDQVLTGLSKAGVGPLLFAGITSPTLFPLIFGSNWSKAGELVTWMTPWFIFQFLASPISMLMHIKNQQKLMLLITVGGLIFRVGFVLCAAFFANEFLSEAYAISSAFFYLSCLIIFSAFVGIKLTDHFQIFWKSKIYIFGWSMTGILVNQLLL
jgi:O-antigen/teichoic acid export membrane protein